MIKKTTVGRMVFVSAVVIFLVTVSCSPYKQDIPVLDLTESPGADYVSLFNGSDFAGWDIGREDGAWSVENGIIHCKGAPADPYLILSENEYENFDFYAEFKVSKDCNTGIFYHVPLAGRQSRIGFETQILDDHGMPPDKNSTGSIYDVVPPVMNAMKKAGKWNQYHVRFDWPVCKVWLNGYLVQDVNFEENPALKYRLRAGFLGLSNHGYTADYRNLWIRTLPDRDTGTDIFNGEDLDGWTVEGDADWHVEDGMIVSTQGEGYLVTEQEYDNVYFHAYAQCDTLQDYHARFYYRWTGADSPGYSADLYDFSDAVKYTEQYGGDIPPDIIRADRSNWFFYRIVSADRQSNVYLNEFLTSDNKLLGKPPRGKIAIYRTAGDGVIRLKRLYLRPLNGPGL
ncbi:family 16 glycoside hydrolase [Candidatus Latescibacterota bacterium]